MKTFGFCNMSFHLSKILFIPFVICLLLLACGEPPENEVSAYLNHSDSAKYVGIATCKLCHQSVYESFIQTGMGRSMGLADKFRSSADFANPVLHDELKDLHYRAFFENDSLYMLEYRMQGEDTLHRLINRVNYIIGSGHHTNSHLHLSGQYLTQMPMTYYTQKGKWDLPPGFENGLNTRFSRKIGLECMTCHNAYPAFVKGSENKYTALPQGIDCERCHGPGSIHVSQRSNGSKIDTSKYVDYSIVNPSKLPVDLQFDICQRCHLQGNTILKEGKSFFDFKPGQRLSDVMTVFLPKYAGAEDEFIMASHADRLKQSQCFIQSSQNAAPSSALKPYQNALTCISCHNPHVSVKATKSEVFDRACIKCHDNTNQIKATHQSLKEFSTRACYTCHMPVSGSTDIPHVSVHDHFIRKPLGPLEKQKIKKFIGLYAINEKNPEPLVKAKAYINYYDKFDQNSAHLDSAAFWLSKCDENASAFQLGVQLNFAKGNPANVMRLLKQAGEEKVLQQWASTSSYDNSWAWTCYRIGECCVQTGQNSKALIWFSKAIELAPFQLDFRNKYANALATANQVKAAIKEFKFILRENPAYVSAYTNLAYLYMVNGDTRTAESLLKTGLKLDPDNESLLLNLAALHLRVNDKAGAQLYLQRVVKLNKDNLSAQAALRQLEKNHE